MDLEVRIIGTYWSAFRWIADVFDIDYKEEAKLDAVIQLLNNNYMVVAACGNGLFTTGGHFIVIYGIEENTLKIYDPYLYSGKFNISTRRGKVEVQGNTVYCSVNNFRQYANYSNFFCFKSDKTQTNTSNKEVVTSTYNRYVKVNTSLNVRTGPGINYSYIRSLYNGEKVIIYEDKGNWSRIGKNEWVCSDYLTDQNETANNTVKQYKKLKQTTTLYSKADLSGIKYTYLKNTRIEILENVSEKVDKIYIPATGRYAYVENSAYSNEELNNDLTGQYKRFKNNTIIYSESNLSGIKYYYLPNTYVKILEDLGEVNKIYVTATKRVGYVSENVYK